MLAMLDDDFFELDEDLLNASDNLVRNDDNTELQEIDYKILFLNCIGEDSFKKLSFHEDSFIRCFDVRTISNGAQKRFINQPMFELNLSEDVLKDANVLQMLLSKARLNIQILHASSRENSSFITNRPFFALRQQVTSFFYQLRQMIISEMVDYSTAESEIGLICNYLNNLNALPIGEVLHTVYSELGNQSKSAAYHLLHGHLEWQWLYLTAVLKINQQKIRANEMLSNISLRETDFEYRLKTFIYDLILLSAAKFNKLAVLELPSKTPFTCVCIKETWLMVQLLIEKLHGDGDQMNSFWSYFNAVLDLYRDSKSPYRNSNCDTAQRDSVTLVPNNMILFSIWLLNGVANLQGFTDDGTFIGFSNFRIKENTEYLENLVKNYLNANPMEQQLRASLLVINSLISEWWTPQSGILMLFWEYFHKKLNSSFFVSGAAPNTLAVSSNSAVGYIEQIQSLLFDGSILHSNSASFSIFIHLLGKLLRRLVQIDMKNQVQKVMGRIFSKFGESKLVALNEIGIHNVISLFLTLAMTTDLQDLGPRLQNILLRMRMEHLNLPRQICLAKGHVAMLILLVEQRINIQGYLQRCLEQINTLNTNDSKLSVMKVLFDGMERLFSRENYFEYGEYLLLDSWLSDYLSLCSMTEQEKCLDFVNKVLTRASSTTTSLLHSEQQMKLQQSIYKYVLKHVKEAYCKGKMFTGVPEIAANFCLIATGQNGLPSFDELFKFFAEDKFCEPQTSTKFLVSILSTNRAECVEETIAIRLWIKFSMLSVTTNDDIQQLMSKIVKMKAFRQICNGDESEILTAKEPLSAFFGGVGRTYDNATEPMKRTIAESFPRCLLGFEKWTTVQETPQLIIKQHIVVALIILNCSQLVYQMSRPSCFFNIAVDKYILPTEILTEKQHPLAKIQAILKVWHLIVAGIEKLSYQSDAHLQKVLHNLVVKWLPQFKSIPNQKLVPKPFISCMLHSKPSTATLIFDKMVSNFLSAQRRETHHFAPAVLNILIDVLAAVENDVEKMGLLLRCTIFTLMEHAMMIDDSLPSKKMIIDFFGNLFKNSTFRESIELRELITSNLKTLTTKHLSYHSTVYFQFTLKMASLNSNVIRDILSHLRQQIDVVEDLRGAGSDAKLRGCLKRLEVAVNY